MACGVPVISSNTGGLPEVNIQGETGFLSDIGDVDDMAKNALSLLTNTKKLDKFRDNALTRAQGFDVKKIVPEYEQYYNEVYDRVMESAMHKEANSKFQVPNSKH